MSDLENAKTSQTQDVNTDKSQEKTAAPVDSKKTKSKSVKPKTVKPKKQKEVKVKLTCDNAAGKYGLPQHRGMTVKLKENQAKEMVDNKDAEYVK